MPSEKIEPRNPSTAADTEKKERLSYRNSSVFSVPRHFFIYHGMTWKSTESDRVGVGYTEQAIVNGRSEIEPLNQIDRLGVIAVIAAILIYVLMAFLGPVTFGSVDQGNVAAAKAQIKQFDTALKSYKLKFGVLPTGLDGLLRPPSGEPIMIAKEVPLDPWGNPYQYSLVGSEAYVVISLGADGKEGGDDEDADIRSDDFVNEAAQ